MISKILALCAAVTITACGLFEKHAGTSTETTNGVELIALDIAGHPLPYARVVLYDRHSQTILDSGLTDSLGVASLTWPQQDSMGHLEIVSQDSAEMLWSWNKSMKVFIGSQILVVPPSSSLRVLSQGMGLQKIHLLGSPYQQESDRDTFDFNHLPAGSWTLAQPPVTPGASFTFVGSINTTSGSAALADISQGTPPVVTLEDFEDGDGFHALASVTGAEGWYLGTTNANWIQPSSQNEIPGAIQFHPNSNTRYLAVRYSLTYSGSMVQMGTRLGASGKYYDFSDLDSIQIRMRGNAQVEFALERTRPDAPNDFEKAKWACTLNDSWQTYTFPVGSEILDSNASQYPFAQVADSLSFASIFFRSGDWVDIDDIRFFGVAPEVFAP